MSKKLSSKIIKIVLIVFALFSTIGCNSSQKNEQILNQKKEIALQNYISSLSASQKISQLFLVNIQGNKEFIPIEKSNGLNGTDDNSFLVPGGCLLFKYNIADTKEDVKSFTDSIYAFYKKQNEVPPFIAIDQEGGSVNRLRGITDNFPSQKTIAENYSLEEAENLYENQSLQMKQLGINMNLAPVVEVENPSNKDFLGTRTFGSLEKVLSYGQKEISIFEKNNVATVLKHFPGNTNSDPHSLLPEISVSKNELYDLYIKPFSVLSKNSSAILMSHAKVKITDNADAECVPSCFSKYFIQDILRNELNFEGLVISDDIFMAALEKNGFPPEIAFEKAFYAGVDILMLSEKRFYNVAELILKKAENSAEFNLILEKAVERVIRFKIKIGLLNFVQTDENETSAKKIEFILR